MNTSIILFWAVCAICIAVAAGACIYVVGLIKRYTDDVDEHNIKHNMNVRFIDANLR